MDELTQALISRKNQLDFNNVRMARNDQVAQDPETQNMLAGKDRYTWARLRASEGPMGAAEQFMAIPGDYLAKKLGLMGGRSDASLQNMAQGYKGMLRGIGDRMEYQEPYIAP